ncbi:MAG: GTP-binding protein [Myxococcales bacterium]|nr:GTP-binding protein [Myxococcales bacterium]
MVPVFLVTGFLGAGKTSLLNQFLARRQRAGEPATRVALVVNELGAVGIDGSLLPDAMSRQIELPGGCICCTLNESFDKTLLGLIEAYPDLEAIIVETTGVAEPLPIIWSCEKSPLAEAVRLAAVITVVDAENILTSFAASPAAESQIVSADVLLVTKHELVPAAQLGQVMAKLADLAPHVLVLSPARDELGAWLASFVASEPLASAAGGHRPTGAGHHHADDGAPHPHGLVAHAYDLPALVDLEALCDAIDELGAGYVRIKGLAYGIDRRTGSEVAHGAVFHRVGRRVSIEPFGGAIEPRMVVIGAHVDDAEIQACLAQARWPRDTVAP